MGRNFIFVSRVFRPVPQLSKKNQRLYISRLRSLNTSDVIRIEKKSLSCTFFYFTKEQSSVDFHNFSIRFNPFSLKKKKKRKNLQFYVRLSGEKTFHVIRPLDFPPTPIAKQDENNETRSTCMQRTLSAWRWRDTVTLLQTQLDTGNDGNCGNVFAWIINLSGYYL